MSNANQADRRMLLGLGGLFATGAIAQVLSSGALAQDVDVSNGAAGPDGCSHSPKQGRKEFALALGGDDRIYKGAAAFLERYNNDPKVRDHFHSLAQPILEKAKNGEDFAREFEHLGKYVSDGVPQPQNCFGIVFYLILLVAVILLES